MPRATTCLAVYAAWFRMNNALHFKSVSYNPKINLLCLSMLKGTWRMVHVSVVGVSKRCELNTWSLIFFLVSEDPKVPKCKYSYRAIQWLVS